MAGASILQWGTSISAWGMGKATHGSRARNQDCDLRQKTYNWLRHYASELAARAREDTEQCPSWRRTRDGWTLKQVK